MDNLMDPSDYRDRPRQPTDDETNSKSRHNALAPISCLPSEILAAIFAFLPPSAWNQEAGKLALICIAHVCHLWRETALNYPLLWSHVNFTLLTPVGMAEILARAKMAPLHLEADTTEFSTPRHDAFERQLESHISHTRHLSIRGDLESPLKRLVSSAPILESLSLSSQKYSFALDALDEADLPINLFNYAAPRLTSIELNRCDISWKSPLLKGLRTLKIRRPSTEARLKLEDWLDALHEMPQLETLILQSATPLVPQTTPLLLEPSRAVTLPSLIRFHISASAKDCAVALAHLVFPALICLRVDAKSHEQEAGDVQLVIPYVARNIHGLQGIEHLRGILISGERSHAELLAWTMPDADFKVFDPDTLLSASVTGLMFTATDSYDSNWRKGTDTAIFDSLLMLLPVDSISILTTQNHTRLSREFWLNHAPRWPLLEQVRLAPNAVKAFRDMLAEGAPPDGPRFPSLTKLILVDVTLTAVRTCFLRDVLIERVEQGVPLETLDLRTCIAVGRTIELLTEIVVDVQEPLAPRSMTMVDLSFSHSHGRYYSGVEYDDGEGPWYGDTDEDEDEVEDDDSWMERDDAWYDHGYRSDSNSGFDSDWSRRCSN